MKRGRILMRVVLLLTLLGLSLSACVGRHGGYVYEQYPSYPAYGVFDFGYGGWGGWHHGWDHSYWGHDSWYHGFAHHGFAEHGGLSGHGGFSGHGGGRRARRRRPRLSEKGLP